MAMNMSSVKLKMNTHANLDTKQPRHVQKTLLNVHTRSHKDNPASIMHILTLPSCPKRSTFSHCDFNYGLVVRNMKKTLFFLFSTFTMRPPASCLRKCLLWDAPSPSTNNQKELLPIKSPKMWRALHTRLWEMGSAPMCSSDTKRGSTGSHSLNVCLVHLLLAFVVGQQHKGQRLNLLSNSCFSGFSWQTK